MNRTYLSLLLLPALGCATAAGPADAPASMPSAEHAEHAEHGHGPEHGTGDPMQHRFEDPAYWSKRFDDPTRDAWQKPAEVLRLMAVTPGQTVADIGAGTGYFLPHLSPAVGPEGRVFALDVEPTLVAHMAKRASDAGLGNVTVKVVPPDDPKLAPGTVDRVLIVDTWHHIGGRVVYAALLRAGLAPGGAVYVVDFTLDSSMGPPKRHRIAPEQVAKTLEAAGLRAEILEEDLPNQYVVRGTRPE